MIYLKMLKKLEPLKLGLGSQSKSYSRTPIRNDFKDNIDAPDLRILKPKNVKNYSKTSSMSPILTQKDKVHQKFKSEYNAFMNKLTLSTEPKKENTQDCLFPIPKLFEPGPSESKSSGINKENVSLVPRSGGSATTNDSLHVIPDNIFPKENAFQLFPKHDFESLESYSEILPKSYIDSETGETKLISKKTVEIWCNGIPICYKDFRTLGPGPHSDLRTLGPGGCPKTSNPEDSLIFVLGPEGSSEESLDSSLVCDTYLFIGYSKKQLYEEYTLVAHDSFFVLDIIEEESYVIPMHQIVRILEYSHVMYLIEKTGKVISDHSYISMIKPCKFQI